MNALWPNFNSHLIAACLIAVASELRIRKIPVVIRPTILGARSVSPAVGAFIIIVATLLAHFILRWWLCGLLCQVAQENPCVVYHTVPIQIAKRPFIAYTFNNESVALIFTFHCFLRQAMWVEGDLRQFLFRLGAVSCGLQALRLFVHAYNNNPIGLACQPTKVII